MSGDPRLEASQALPDFDYAGYARLVGLHGIRVDDPDAVGAAWDECLNAGRPAVLEVITDPEVPPLPPHIRFEQARGMAKAIARRDPAARPDDHPVAEGQARGVRQPMKVLRDWRRGRAQKLLSAATAVSALPLGFEIYFEHYSGSFGDKWMWTPIGSPPALSAAGVAGVVSERAARTVLPALSALYCLDGAVGVFTPPARRRAQAGRLPRADVQLRHGTAAARAGLAGHGRRHRDLPPRSSRRETLMAGSISPRRPPAQARRPRPPPRELPRQRRGTTPQMHGRYPDYDVLDNAGHWDPVTRELVDRARRRRPAAAVLHRATRRPTLRRVLRRRSRPGLRAADPGARDDRREAARRRARRLPATRTCPTTATPGGWSPRARRRRRQAARSLRRLRHRAPQRAWSAGFADGELDGGSGTLDRAPRPGAWSCARCLAGVLLASVGVERDRLRRAGLPARLRPPRRGGGQREPGRRRGVRRDPVAAPSAGCEDRAGAVIKGVACRRATTTRRSCSTPHARHPAAPRAWPLRRRRRGRPGDRRRRRGRRDARPAPGPPRLADRRARARAVLGSRSRLGLRRGRLAQALLDRATRIIGGDDPVELGKNNSRPRRRRLDDPLRRLRAALPPLRLRGPHARRRRRRLADLLRRAQAALRAGRARAAGRRPGLAVGRPARLPARAAPDLRRRRAAPARGARAAGIEMRVGPVAITNGAFGNRPHCIYRGFCLQGCKVNAKASPLVTHVPDAIEHGVEIRADSHGGAGRGRRDRPRSPASPTCTTAASASSAPPPSRVCRLLDRDAAAAAELDQPPLPARARQRQRPGRPLRDGAGRAAGRRALPRDAAHVQGAAARDLLRAVLRDRRGARLRARVLDPDRRPAADRLGRARARRRPLGPRAARVHARLQPLVRRSASLCELLPQPDNRVTLADETDRHGMPVARFDYTPVRQRPREHRLRQADAARHLGGRRRPGRADDRPLRPPRRRLPDGRRAREQRHRRRPPRLGRRRTCSSPTAA